MFIVTLLKIAKNENNQKFKHCKYIKMLIHIHKNHSIHTHNSIKFYFYLALKSMKICLLSQYRQN